MHLAAANYSSTPYDTGRLEDPLRNCSATSLPRECRYHRSLPSCHISELTMPLDVYLSMIVVFTGLRNVALAVLRYRIGEKPLLSSLFTNLMWILLMSIFLGGLSLHVSQALLSHLGATSKEAENTTFFQEVPKVIKKFSMTFAFCIIASLGMVALALFVPEFWRIDQFFAIFPLATVIVSHFMLPIVLNPSLMLFTW
ncbi:hypothetical protein D6D21_07470 [Aureobasidium pullulans]|uniref:Uncharacterized protein n=1 Tax=Aureobasidium pullulans TaxID=5580 RepID=A0AB74IRW1_AURPU|nr:hypothetical protein D6D21_07470 [Aureobasidium pullulans]